LPDAAASMSSVIRAARKSWEESDRRRAMRTKCDVRRRFAHPYESGMPGTDSTRPARPALVRTGPYGRRGRWSFAPPIGSIVLVGLREGPAIPRTRPPSTTKAGRRRTAEPTSPVRFFRPLATDRL
jgi:hypothetical protein